MDIKQELMKDFFYNYDLNEVCERDAVDYHAMTGEHTEVLGQFLDITAMNVNDLKDCLIMGYLNRIMNKVRNIPKPVIRFDNYNHEWSAGRCPNCNKIISFDFSVGKGEEGNRKCYCSKCGQLCDFEDM